MASYSQVAAERYLTTQIDLQRRVMTKRGIASATIDEHLKALEAGIRVALWRRVLTPSGGAA